MVGTIGIAETVRKHRLATLHDIVSRQRKTPAVYLLVGIVASPVSDGAKALECRIVRDHVHLHVEIVFVVDFRMVRQ